MATTNNLTPSGNQELIQFIRSGFQRLEVQNLEIKSQNLEIKSQNQEIKAQNQLLYARIEELENTVVLRLDRIEHCVITIRDQVAFSLPLDPSIPEHREVQEEIQAAANEIAENVEEYIPQCVEITTKTTDRNTKTQFRAIQNQYNLESGRYEELTHGEKTAEGNWIGSRMTGFNTLVGAPGSKELKNCYPRMAEKLVGGLSKCYHMFQPIAVRMY